MVVGLNERQRVLRRLFAAPDLSVGDEEQLFGGVLFEAGEFEVLVPIWARAKGR